MITISHSFLPNLSATKETMQ